MGGVKEGGCRRGVGDMGKWEGWRGGNVGWNGRHRHGVGVWQRCT